MSENRKLGAGHLEAWIRGGGKEFAQVLPAFPQSIRVVEEPGLFGNPTPQEIVADKGKDGLYGEWLNSRAQEARAREPERDELGLEL